MEKIFAKLFGSARYEVQPPVSEDQRCVTCRKFLLHSATRVECAGQVFCSRECIPPSLIREAEEAARLAEINRQQQANLADAAARDNQTKYLEESLELLKDPTVREVLTRYGVNLAQTEEALDRKLHPYRRKYLPKGERHFTVRHGANIIHIQPTD